MNNRLYKLMNWPAIEEIIYAECDHPFDILGPVNKGNSTLIQTFWPGATSVALQYDGEGTGKYDKEIAMDIADEEGFFAALAPVKNLRKYRFAVAYQEESGETAKRGKTKTYNKRIEIKYDAYSFGYVLKKSDLDKYAAGSLANLQDILGAHVTEINGVSGVHFSVWAPSAMRVSVVGEFNGWDGRCNQMQRVGDSEVFELFVPGLKSGDAYRFELKYHGRILIKNDPLALSQNGEDGPSVVCGSNDFSWEDLNFIKKRKKAYTDGISIMEVYPGSYCDAEGQIRNIASIAEEVAQKAVKGGFSHVLLTPIAEYCYDASFGYAPCSFFAFTSRYGNSQDLKSFVNTLHKAGISVGFDWVPSHFSNNAYGMAAFDGTSLYEHADPRQGICPEDGSMLFRYGSAKVDSFLLSCGLYWVREYHFDAVKMDGVSRMLYLDYSRADGEWVPNMYGGNENLDAIRFIQEFNKKVHKEFSGVVTIAEDSSAHPDITKKIDDGGLGFDYKLNGGFSIDYIDYMSTDPLYRGGKHSQLTLSTVYAYAERFILPFSHRETGIGVGDFAKRFPGNPSLQAANERISLAYMMTHPGGKLVYADALLPETVLLAGALNKLYYNQPALHVMDDSNDGFEWLNAMSAEHNYISFARKTDDPEELLVVVANFAGIEQTITTGVPYEGKYKEILNTDAKEFGGSGIVNGTVKRAVDQVADGRMQSISVKLAPLSVAVFSFIPYTQEEFEKVIEERLRKNTPILRSKTTKGKGKK